MPRAGLRMRCDAMVRPRRLVVDELLYHLTVQRAVQSRSAIADAHEESNRGVEHMFVASRQRMRVHATHHNCTTRSSASGFTSSTIIENPCTPASLTPERNVRQPKWAIAGTAPQLPRPGFK